MNPQEWKSEVGKKLKAFLDLKKRVTEDIEATRHAFAEGIGLPSYKDKVLVNGSIVTHVRKVVIENDLTIRLDYFHTTKDGVMTRGYAKPIKTHTVKVLAYCIGDEWTYPAHDTPVVDVEGLNGAKRVEATIGFHNPETDRT